MQISDEAFFQQNPERQFRLRQPFLHEHQTLLKSVKANAPIVGILVLADPSLLTPRQTMEVIHGRPITREPLRLFPFCCSKARWAELEANEKACGDVRCQALWFDIDTDVPDEGELPRLGSKNRQLG